MLRRPAHLESTEAGLAALTDTLTDDGALFLMLYGRYGRQVVYDMQRLLRDFLPAGLGMQEKLRLTRQLLAALPKSNGFARDYSAWRSEIDAAGLGDAGLYDLLLHSQDRCFDVPELYRLAASAGLHILGFASRAEAYDPLIHVSDPALASILAGYDLPRQQALAEQLAGDIRKHEFFLARSGGRSATLADGGLALRSYGTMLENAPRVAADMVPGRTLRYRDPDHSFPIACTPVARLVYAHMDGRTALADLRRRIRAAVPDVSAADVDAEIALIYQQLHPRGYLYLIEAGRYGVTVPDYARLR